MKEEIMDARWQKSSLSDQSEGGACVEVGHSTHAGILLVREGDHPSAIIETSASMFDGLLEGIKNGDLDLTPRI
ncbi:DUF397 domain-containing protein [Streptomyces sp. NPDC003077]|uniref:DUF397 domain-containing protein n=1 Tax=Streptomyces sp. NPDC003077 TaxID=3154443 RepID=UPI0033A05CA3